MTLFSFMYLFSFATLISFCYFSINWLYSYWIFRNHNNGSIHCDLRHPQDLQTSTWGEQRCDRSDILPEAVLRAPRAEEHLQHVAPAARWGTAAAGPRQRSGGLLRQLRPAGQARALRGEGGQQAPQLQRAARAGGYIHTVHYMHDIYNTCPSTRWWAGCCSPP